MADGSGKCGFRREWSGGPVNTISQVGKKTDNHMKNVLINMHKKYTKPGNRFYYRVTVVKLDTRKARC